MEGIFGKQPDLISPEELPEWIVVDTADYLVVNKPGWVVCHPSKNGPWSSLVGALREWSGIDRMHLVSRLDRETSGIIVIAKNRAYARAMQMALMDQRCEKRYEAILEGELREEVCVDNRLRPNRTSRVVIEQEVTFGPPGKRAVTLFRPLAWKAGFTRVEVIPETGRKHQIRAHARWLGHSVVGDKIYGPDAKWYLEFIVDGWTPAMVPALRHPRQLLHACSMELNTERGDFKFQAPVADDFERFWAGLDSK